MSTLLRSASSVRLRASELECCTLGLKVLDGGSGQLAERDINFLLISPGGQTLLADYKQSRGDHQLNASQTGDYKVCLSNKFSFLSLKTVNLEVVVGLEDELEDLAGLSYLREEDQDSEIDHFHSEIGSQLIRIKDLLGRASRLQDHIRVTDTKDRKICEHNFERVNFLSACGLIVLLGSSLTQVILLRSLFEEKSKINLVWKRRANF